MANATFKTERWSRPATLSGVSGRPGCYRLRADTVGTPAQLLELAQWLQVEAEARAAPAPVDEP